MQPKTPLDNLLDRAGQLFGQTESNAELQRSIKMIVESMISKMNLVTREEFDAQTQVLQRTRERLEALEEQLKKLEQAGKSE
ncbi:hypothetical protein NBRC116493_00120 [Aurantivibrio infirmus]